MPRRSFKQLTASRTNLVAARRAKARKLRGKPEGKLAFTKRKSLEHRAAFVKNGDPEHLRRAFKYDTRRSASNRIRYKRHDSERRLREVVERAMRTQGR